MEKCFAAVVEFLLEEARIWPDAYSSIEEIADRTDFPISTVRVVLQNGSSQNGHFEHPTHSAAPNPPQNYRLSRTGLCQMIKELSLAEEMLQRVKGALNTDEDGDNLVAVARDAVAAEMRESSRANTRR